MSNFTSKGLILILLWYVLLHLNTISSNLPIYMFLDVKVIFLSILLFKILINLLATTDYPSLCLEYMSISFFSSFDFIDLLLNSLLLFTSTLFGLRLNSFKTFWKALLIATPFLFLLLNEWPCIFTINVNNTW